MEEKIYKITRIEGEYAYLTPEDAQDELFIALALLPFGVDIGSRLIYRDMEFYVL